MLGTTRVGVVIVAAGSSVRLGADKMFVSLASQPLLSHTVAVFDAHPSVDEIVLVMSPSNLEQGRLLAQRRRWGRLCHICIGGARRQDSVVAGLRCVDRCGIVMIHDGARPLVDREVLDAGLVAVQQTGAAIAVVPVKDTIKQVEPDGIVKATLRRESLRAVQTPQVFDYGLIMNAYAQLLEGDFTDDAAVVEATGHKVVVFDGSYDNIKVTTPEDVELAEAILRRRNAGA